MAGKNVDTNSLRQAAGALSKYISEISESIHKMKDAAQDCSDNMGSDVYSQRAVANLNTCVSELSLTMVEAEELRKRILKQAQTIENSMQGY